MIRAVGLEVQVLYFVFQGDVGPPGRPGRDGEPGNTVFSSTFFWFGASCKPAPCSLTASAAYMYINM